ncbi:MAG: 23S rRNA (adenine(2503)-C(2))-methyltransferase RlmN, partial [Spirochaetes bacterium]|nr:23S rRNA (adenine(2503)-C(2))-methyltransferase RlmN [Spirochaetota bacterium]
QFQELLNQKGLRTTLRRSRGQDIEAACGQLSTQKFFKNRTIQSPLSL